MSDSPIRDGAAWIVAYALAAALLAVALFGWPKPPQVDGSAPPDAGNRHGVVLP